MRKLNSSENSDATTDACVARASCHLHVDALGTLRLSQEAAKPFHWRFQALTLSVRPVWLNKSIYLRVPNDIADLIEIDHQAKVTLSFEEKNDRFLLVYAVQKQIPLAAALPATQIQTPTTNEPEAGQKYKHGKPDA